MLANVDTLREAWELSLEQASPGEFAEARRRSLRRHAIETGIIERLYDDLGITEALVVEGLTAEVAASKGVFNDDVSDDPNGRWVEVCESSGAHSENVSTDTPGSS